MKKYVQKLDEFLLEQKSKPREWTKEKLQKFDEDSLKYLQIHDYLELDDALGPYRSGWRSMTPTQQKSLRNSEKVTGHYYDTFFKTFPTEDSFVQKQKGKPTEDSMGRKTTFDEEYLRREYGIMQKMKKQRDEKLKSPL